MDYLEIELGKHRLKLVYVCALMRTAVDGTTLSGSIHVNTFPVLDTWYDSIIRSSETLTNQNTLGLVKTP